MNKPLSNTPLSGEKIAVLVANGFSEQTLTALQRAIQKLGGTLRLVSMDQGLVNGWNGEGWGLSFAADQPLSAALAADYSALIVPGGERSIEKLKLTAHTRRFISGFLDTGKPVVIADDAVDLLNHIEKTAGRNMAGPEGLKGAIEQAGGLYVAETYAVQDNLMTGDMGAHAAEAADFLASNFTLEQAA